MCYITLSFQPFRGDSTRYEVDIAEKVLMSEQYTIHNENCCARVIFEEGREYTVWNEYDETSIIDRYGNEAKKRYFICMYSGKQLRRLLLAVQNS